MTVPPPNRGRTRGAIAGFFFVNGTLFSTWVSRIPGVKQTRDLDTGRLGLALLALGLGTVVGLPLTSRLIHRHGSRPVVVGAALAAALALPLAAIAPGYAGLFAGLFVVGANLGALDVAMNAQASHLELGAGRSLMSSFHGLWSLGGITGALLGSALTARGVSPAGHFALVALLVALVALLARDGLLDDRSPDASPSGPAFALPSGRTLAVGAIAACGAVVEGGVADWSGVYLRESLHAGAATAPLGFGAFSLTMMAARFVGDRLIDRFGRRALLRLGPALTAGGIALGLATDHPLVAITALAAAGLGMATVFPIAFGEAGALPGRPGHAIAAVATMAYGAQLLGPPVIGFVAEATSLPTAMALMIAAALAIVLLSGRVSLRPHATRAPERVTS